MRKLLLLVLFSFFIISIHSVRAQTPTATAVPAPVPSGIKANLAVGEVLAVSQNDNKLSLKTSDGNIEVLLAAATAYKRVPPENPSLKAAVESSLSEIGVGDKIIVTGAVSADKKSMPAKTVYLMTKSDIAKRNAAERELWRTRGIFGRVVSIDFKTQRVTLATRTQIGETNVVLSPKESARYQRYAPDSVKFSDVFDSSLAEIKVGDQLRVLGDKSADGTSFKGEHYVSGSFKMVAGKVTAVDIAKNEITIEDAQTKKPVIVVVNSNSMMKKFPLEMAQMLAMRMSGGGQPTPGGQGATTFTMRPPQAGSNAASTSPGVEGTQPGGKTSAPSGQPPANGVTTTQTAGRQGPGGQGPGNFGRGGARGSGDLDDVLERLPTLNIADLKIGDSIGVSSTAGLVPNRVTAIKLVSGVEPFLKAPQIANVGGGRGNQAPTINIPGLDSGFGTP